MTLRIKRRLHVIRNLGIIGGWFIGIVATFGAPLSQAIIVTSPSTSMGLSGKKYTVATEQTSKNRTASSKSVQKKSSAATAPQTFQSSLTTRNTNCTSPSPIHAGLATSGSSQLRKLAQYETVCQSTVATTASFFVAMPTTTGEASDYASDVIIQLREFAKFDITPLVFMEPTNNGGLVNLSEYRAGAYDTAVDTYFAAIKAAGISDAMMGTWVPLPEGNIPVWSSIDPTDFSASVTKTVRFQKKYFPTSRASILLDNQTYPTAGSWSGGRAISLLPYVSGIPAGLIDSVGLQGFPWSPAANEAGPTNGEPSNYLRSGLLVEAARSLGVKNVWVNTGTFGTKYAGIATKQVTVTPERRLALLTAVVSELKKLQNQGFTVSAHIFAENKANVPEATNWSYWPSGQATTSPSTVVFKTFVRDLQANAIPLWLFDTDES